MKIECLRRRQNGTVVTIGTEIYHFKPEEEGKDGPHVADVTIKAHLARLLDIKEGYRRLPGEKPAKVVSDQQTGTTNLTPTPDTGNAGDQQTGPDNIGQDGEDADQTEDDSEGDKRTIDLDEIEEDVLRAIFEKEVGRKPSPRAGRDTMIAQINAAREAAE